MSKEKRGPRGPRGFPGLTGPVGPAGAPGLTAKPSWLDHGTDIGPGLHVRQWRDPITGDKKYSIVHATVYNEGQGPQVTVATLAGAMSGNVLTDYEIGTSYFMRFS